MDTSEATFPSLSHRESLHQYYQLTGGRKQGGEYKPYSEWGATDLWQWFAYHHAWFWFHQRQFYPTCPVDTDGHRFNLDLVSAAFEMYCRVKCAACRDNFRREGQPCKNHRPPERSGAPPIRTPEEIAEVERKARAAIFAIQRWDERNKEAFNPIAAVHELLGVTASERAQLRDEMLDVPAPEQSPMQRRRQLDEYIRGELAFKGQRHDSRATLEAALANAHRATARTPPPELSSEIPAWVIENPQA